MTDRNKITKPNELCFQLIPAEWLASLAYLAAKGAQKYSARDWEENPGDYMNRIDSCKRHLNDWLAGEDYDNGAGGTGVPNLAAVAYNALMVMVWQAREVGLDNRPEVATEFIDDLKTKLREPDTLPVDLSPLPPQKQLFHRDMIIGPFSSATYFEECKDRLLREGEAVIETSTYGMGYYIYLRFSPSFQKNGRWGGTNDSEDVTPTPYSLVEFPND